MDRTQLMVSVVLLLLFPFASIADCAVVYVISGGTGLQDGSSWDNACATISAGIVASVSGDEVWVKYGRYNEAVEMKEGVALYGGFNSTEQSRDERDFNGLKPLIDATGLNAQAVLGADTAILDGFTVTGGTGRYGAGVVCLGTSPSLANCVITGNTAIGSDSRGGGMYCVGSTLTMTNCTISNNRSEQNGGGVSSAGGHLTLIDCTISDNESGAGGGLSCAGLSLINCVIARNVANSGGALSSGSNSPTLINCTLVGNIAQLGSAIACSVHSSASPTITNCILWNKGTEIFPGPYGSPSVEYSCVQGGWPGVGNIDALPRFIDPIDGDFRLKNNSPCIDRGLLSDAPTTDKVGSPRPGEDGLVDMGAYESPGDYLPGPAMHTPGILRVKSDAGERGDGSSWRKAFSSISAALEVCGTSDEIWVAGGEYMEWVPLEPRVGLFGGFYGTESSFDDRPWDLAETIINASGENRPTVAGADLATLDGFEVTGSEIHGLYFSWTSPTIRNCVITNNAARNGGGLFCNTSSAALTNCKFVANDALVEGGAIYCLYSSPILTNCTIIGNSIAIRGRGGALYCRESFPNLINCTIAENAAAFGAGLYCDKSAPIITNSILCNGGDEISPAFALPTITYSCIQGGYTGEGNIDRDPEFVHRWDGTNGDYRLRGSSPCIDTGRSLVLQVPSDIERTRRPYDIPRVGFDGDGQGYDMGAYEFCPPPRVLHVLRDWHNGETGFTDINHDRAIDAIDLFILMKSWPNN